MGQLTFNHHCNVVHGLPIAKEAMDIKCTTGTTAIDCKYSNQLPSVFISAIPVTILWEWACEIYCSIVSCMW